MSTKPVYPSQSRGPLGMCSDECCEIRFGALPPLPPGYSVWWHADHGHYQGHGPREAESDITCRRHAARRWCFEHAVEAQAQAQADAIERALTDEEQRAALAGTLTEIRRPCRQAARSGAALYVPDPKPATSVRPDRTGRGWIAWWGELTSAEWEALHYPWGGFPCPFGAPGDTIDPGLRIASVRVELDGGVWTWIVAVKKDGA